MVKIEVVFAHPEANRKAKEHRKAITEAIDKALADIRIGAGSRWDTLFSRSDYAVNVTY